MSKRLFFSTITMAAVITALSGAAVATAGFPAPPGVNVQINGYLPSPPGVRILLDSGRPYYVERNRRVYVERDPRHYRKKHYRDRYGNGHDNRGRGNGHGR